MVTFSRCVRCGACAACPAGARGPHGEYDAARCVGCGLCASVCPAEACRLVGLSVSAEDVLARILPDKPFFRERGGVTLTGGEPMAQPVFARELAVLIAGRGIHLAMETSGYAPWEHFSAILPLMRLFLYDWKVTDPEAHRRWTGVDNRLIRENLRKLHDAGAEIVLRCPIIPGVNDTEAHFEGIARLRDALPRIRRVELLPYHGLGNAKRAQLGLPPDGFHAPGEETVRRWSEKLGVEKQDFNTAR